MEKLEVTKAEKNRLIAEWIEPMPTDSGRGPFFGTSASPLGAWFWTPKWEHVFKQCPAHLGDFNNIRASWCTFCNPQVDNGSWQPADFYVSEVASALIIEKARMNIVSYACGKWYAGADYNDERWHYVDLDRKTAIAEVAYQVAEAHKEKANG